MNVDSPRVVEIRDTDVDDCDDDGDCKSGAVEIPMSATGND